MFKSKPGPANKRKQPESETMEDVIALIRHGCKLAQHLESDLQNLANQPEILSQCCDEIIKRFAMAKERLTNAQDSTLFRGAHNSSQQQQQQQQSSDPSLQEWLKHMIQQQILAGKTPIEINEMGGKNLLEGTSSAVSSWLKSSVGGDIQAMDVSDSGRASSSSSQRLRRSRKDEEEKCIVTVPAPQMGNTDLPPEDNYTWRKYGQKEILGSRYPRAYYRCTHQKMYNCPAKKQVQRLDNDFYTFEVTYIGQHTCHMSSTAPSIPPPPPPPAAAATPPVHDNSTQDHHQQMMMMTQAMATQPLPTTSSSSIPMGRWLSMELISLASASASAPGVSAAGGSTTTAATRYGRDVVDYPAVADLADVMFNSGSSSSNSMDFIFPTAEDKWETGGKKN